MPLRHGLDVSIVSSSSYERFTEYGVNTHARSKLVTAKIEARSGVQFYIAIRAEDPFPTEQNKRYGSSILTRAQASGCPTHPLPVPPPAPRKRNSHTYPPLPRKCLPTPAPKPPPFDLIAQVYIDGRAKAENRSIITLDPSSPDYEPEVLLMGRRVRIPSTTGGPTRQCFYDWVFTDVGIEVLLERMGVEDAAEFDAPGGGDHEVAGLAELLQDAAKVEEEGGETGDEEGEEQELKIGKIEIVFTRVMVGGVMDDLAVAASQSLQDAQSEQPLPKRSVGKDVTHTTSIVPSSRESESPLYEYRRIKWTHYNRNEEFYAKFKFDYTSRAKLVKWGLCDDAGVPIGKGQEMQKQSSTHQVQLRAGNVSAGPDDSGQEQSGSRSRAGNGGQIADLVLATEHTETHIKGGGGGKRGEGEERDPAPRKRELARLETGARTDAVANADAEREQHKPAKRRHRLTRLTRLTRTDKGE